MRAVLCCLVMMAVARVAAGAIEVVVTLRSGATVEKTVAATEFTVTASFGKATIEAGHLTAVEFAPGEGNDIITTSDGTRLNGRIEGDVVGMLGVAGTGGMVERGDIASLLVIRKAELRAGTITDGVARNGVAYHLRAPEGFDGAAAGGEPRRAIVILHGSNMNSRAYVNTIAQRWPGIAARYVLIGVNGERRNPPNAGAEPSFNYTYVNYVGKSRYKGYAGTDRESPALVAEVVRELKDRFNIGTVFVGGHSQGGYLTYSLMMNTPELFNGAFPISSGLIFQCEPGAYEKAEVIAAQRRVPLVIVHARNDKVVDFGMSEYAWERFEDAGFPMVRLLADEIGAHMFARLPIDEAIAWLEVMNSTDPKLLLEHAEKWMGIADERDAGILLRRLKEMPLDDEAAGRRDGLARALEEESAGEAAKIVAVIDAASSTGAWVDDFLSYRARFVHTDAAAPLVKKYEDLRRAQQKRADDLFGQARQAYERGDKKKGRELAEQLARECYASDKYVIVKGWLKE